VLSGGLCHSLQSNCRDIVVDFNADWCVDIQVYDRLAQTDVTVELVMQLFSAIYSVTAADEVFSLSSEYDGLRMVIDAMCRACCSWHGACLHVYCMFVCCMHCVDQYQHVCGEIV